MGVIPNITEEDKQIILDHMEATLRANLRDAERDMSQADGELALAERKYCLAREAYRAANQALDVFMQSKIIS